MYSKVYSRVYWRVCKVYIRVYSRMYSGEPVSIEGTGGKHCYVRS